MLNSCLADLLTPSSREEVYFISQILHENSSAFLVAQRMPESKNIILAHRRTRHECTDSGSERISSSSI